MQGRQGSNILTLCRGESLPKIEGKETEVQVSYLKFQR